MGYDDCGLGQSGREIDLNRPGTLRYMVQLVILLCPSYSRSAVRKFHTYQKLHGDSGFRDGDGRRRMRDCRQRGAEKDKIRSYFFAARR